MARCFTCKQDLVWEPVSRIFVHEDFARRLMHLPTPVTPVEDGDSE